jgi:predicted MFS family arabinose efflux permease
VYAAWTIAAGLGLAAAGFVPVLKLLAVTSGAHFARDTGTAVAGAGLGTLVIAPALQSTISDAGWRVAVAGLAVVVVGALLLSVVIGAPGRAPSVVRGSLSSAPLELPRGQGVAYLMLAQASVGYSLLLQTHQVAHLIQVGVSAATAAQVAGLFGLCMGMGSLGAGWCIERWGAVPVQAWAAVLLSVGIVALVISGPTMPWLLLVYAVVGALGRGALGVGVYGVARHAVRLQAFGTISGLLNLSFGLGAVVGPWLVALAFDWSGSYAPGLLTCLVANLGAGLFTAAAERAEGRS